MREIQIWRETYEGRPIIWVVLVRPYPGSPYRRGRVVGTINDNRPFGGQDEARAYAYDEATRRKIPWNSSILGEQP